MEEIREEEAQNSQNEELVHMIFIQLVVCFLSPRQGSGIENTKLVG